MFSKLNAFGFQESVETKTRRQLTNITVSTRKCEVQKSKLRADLDVLEAIHPRTTAIATDIKKLRARLAKINGQLDKNENIESLIEAAQSSTNDIDVTELLGVMHERNAKKADPMRLAMVIENSNAARDRTDDVKEMLTDHLKSPELQPTEKDTDDIASIMAEVASTPLVPPSIPSSLPVLQPVHSSFSQPVYSSSSSSSSLTMTRESPLPTYILSLEDRLARLAAP